MLVGEFTQGLERRTPELYEIEHGIRHVDLGCLAKQFDIDDNISIDEAEAGCGFDCRAIGYKTQ